jgi:hypothetical protein
VLNSPVSNSFLFFGNVFISPSFLKDSFIAHRIHSLQLFLKSI